MGSPTVLWWQTLKSGQAILLWRHQVTTLAEPRWHLLQSDITEHCKSCP